MGSHQDLLYNHSPLGLLKSSSNTHSRGILFTIRSFTFTRYNWHKTRTRKAARILSVLDRFWQRSQENMMTTRIVSARSFFATMHTNKVTWLIGLEPNNYQNKVLHTWLKTVVWPLTSEQDNKGTSDRNDEKYGRPSQTDVIFVVMDALVNVLVGEVLILHCHENGDCHAVALRASSELSQSADCQLVRSRVWSELLQSAGDYQSERSRVVRPNSICTLANLPINPRSVVGQEEKSVYVTTNTCPLTST